MSEFKVGARVRVRSSVAHGGKQGTVVPIGDQDHWPVWVHLDGFPSKLGYAENELELISSSTNEVLNEVREERARQDARWDEQNHPDIPRGEAEYARVMYGQRASAYKHLNDGRAKSGDTSWDLVLLEEVFEALSEEDPARLREELVQVAAVACAWIEAIDRRQGVREAD